MTEPTKTDGRKNSTINERLYDCADRLQDFVDILRACADGNINRNEIGIRYGYRPQRIQQEIKRGFQCLIREKIGHQLTEEDVITCMLALEPPSDRVLKDVLGISRNTLAMFPTYDPEHAYDLCFNALTTNEQTIFHLYYSERKHTPEIARMLELSKTRVCQIRNDILEKLRNPLILADIWPDEKLIQMRAGEKAIRSKVNDTIKSARERKTDDEIAKYRVTLKKLKQKITLEEQKLNTRNRHETIGRITYIDEVRQEFSTRTYNAIKNAGYETIDDIVKDYPSKFELLNSTTNYNHAKRNHQKPSIPNLGKKSANELANWMIYHNYY